MKKIFTLPLIIALTLVLIQPILSFADMSSDTYTVSLYEVIDDDNDCDNDSDSDHRKTIDPDGERSAKLPFVCYIVRNEGIFITDIYKEDIVSYTIYNESENWEVTFFDDKEFANYIFSKSGEFKISIALQNFNSLEGYISVVL